jgi:arsenite methyltransferase
MRRSSPNASATQMWNFAKAASRTLRLDLEMLDQELKKKPITDAASFLRADELAEELRVKHPLIISDSIDVVVSSCVLNLVEPKSKPQLFDEIFRVLKKGGRAVISDIVSDEVVPEEMQNDPELWSGCISGAFSEDGFLAAFENAGFYGIQILKRDVNPWRTVQGIEFRSVTVEAFKGKQGECFERNQAVIYRGPFKEVLDDDNHRMERGKRYAVGDKTYNLYKKAPYRECFEFVDPITDVPLAEANPFDCARTVLRHPKETKGQDYNATTEPNNKCCDGGGCC